MQMSLAEIVLLQVFRCARTNRRPNLTALCRRAGASAQELESVFERLEQQGFLSFGAEGERLTLAGLALGAALSRAASRRHRPLAACRRLAA
jgi:hypothetical protein